MRPESRYSVSGLAALSAFVLLSGCAPGPDQTVPIRLLQGAENSTLILAPVSVQGQGPFIFILDTGASKSSIAKPLAEQLGLQPVGKPIEMMGVIGEERVVIAKVDTWQIGDVALPAGTIAELAVPHRHTEQAGPIVGLLGSDVLSRFGTVTVDYARQLLVLPRR